MDAITLHLEDRRLRRLGRFEALQQGGAAVLLVWAALRRFPASSPTELFVAGAQLLTGTALLWAAAHELRGTASARLGWLNVAAGLALLVEWGDSRVHGAKLVQPSLVMGVLSLGLGLLQTRFDRWRNGRRRLRVDGTGLFFRLSPLRRFHLLWTEVAWVTIRPAEVRFGCRSGREHRIPLKRLENAREVAEVILEFSRRAGVEIRPGRHVDGLQQTSGRPASMLASDEGASQIAP